MADEKKAAGPPKAPKKKGFVLFEQPLEGTTRWLQPIEEIAFKVQIRYLSDEEQTAIFDKHKLYPGSTKNTMKKLNDVASDMIDAKVVDWKDPQTIFPDVPADYPCSGLNKQRLQNVFFRRENDDELTTLWKMILRAEEKAAEEEAKN